MTSRNLSLLFIILAVALLFSQLPSIEQLTNSSNAEENTETVIRKSELSQTNAPQTIETQTGSSKPIELELVEPKQSDKTQVAKVIKEAVVKTTTDSGIPDFATIKDVKQKKTQFFGFMLKNIAPANRKVKEERDSLLELTQLYSKNKIFTQPEQLLFLKLSKKYRVDKSDSSVEKKLNMLKQKIDQVPASLILAQSANESAWGTSRFARKGNNYFGQWCYSKGCGLVPASRDSGASHEVAKFSSVEKSVEGYIYNINVGRSYKKIRQMREEMLNNQQPIDSLKLATGLEKYSERGKEYVKEIQSMIRFNKLQAYD